MDKSEFEPRITRLRHTSQPLEEQRRALAEEVALRGDMQLIIGRLEDFATKLHERPESQIRRANATLSGRWSTEWKYAERGQCRVSFDHIRVITIPKKKVCKFRGRDCPTAGAMWHWMGWKGCSTQNMPMDDPRRPQPVRQGSQQRHSGHALCG